VCATQRFGVRRLGAAFTKREQAPALQSCCHAQAGAERSSAANRQNRSLGAAISAAGEELQVSGRKMAFAAGHDQR